MGTRGPAPDPQALRRDRKDDQATWTLLPSEGRQGEAPEWPFGHPSKAELKQWDREWKRPQAVMWERDGQQEEVAVYVSTLVGGDPRLRSVLLRQQESLGLSQPGLARRRWKITEEPERQERARTDDPDRAAKKAKLLSITGGTVA